VTNNKLGPAILLIIGGIIIASSGKGCDAPWPFPLPPVVVETYPDAWLVFIEESSDRDIDLAILLQSKSWIDSLAARKINYRVYDQDQPEARSYKPLLKDLPQLFFVTPQGKVVRQVNAPKNAAAVDSLIKEVMGK